MFCGFCLISMQFVLLVLLCSCNYAPCDAGLFGGGFINIVNTLHFQMLHQYLFRAIPASRTLQIRHIFVYFRSLHHIFAPCKSKIIRTHYKAVIMDDADEFYATFLNRLSDIVYNDCRHGHYIFWALLFT